jgi:nitroreductase
MPDDELLMLVVRQGRCGMQFSDVIDRRRSIRAFRATPVEEEKIKAILAAARLAPSAGDLQAYRIVVVTDAEAKALLAKAALGQQFIAEAPIVLVFLADTRRSKAKYGSRGAELFCLQDATIAAAYAQLAATEANLGSCWVGAFDDDEVSKSLGAPAHLRPVALIPLGYAAEMPERPPRRALRELVQSERF